MPLLHDPETKRALQQRVQALTPDAPRQWGAMTVDQMLWHVNGALDMALGRHDQPLETQPMPVPILRFVVLNLPWIKGAPTNPGLKASGQHDFDTERRRTLALIDEFTAKAITSEWPKSPILGAMTGKQASKLQAKHLDHHLRQFGS